MGDRFVSEKEVEEEKKLRQEEWDRVRKPEDPKVAPETDAYDNRPLFERLKEQREKKQLEFEETHRLKNIVRGLDTEEAGFLDFVDNMKSAEEKKRENEEKQLFMEVQKPNKQAQLLSKAVKRKSDSSDSDSDDGDYSTVLLPNAAAAPGPASAQNSRCDGEGAKVARSSSQSSDKK